MCLSVPRQTVNETQHEDQSVTSFLSVTLSDGVAVSVGDFFFSLAVNLIALEGVDHS